MNHASRDGAGRLNEDEMRGRDTISAAIPDWSRERCESFWIQSSLVALDPRLSILEKAWDSLAMVQQVLGYPTPFLEHHHGSRYPAQLRYRRWTEPDSSQRRGHLSRLSYRPQLSNIPTGDDRGRRLQVRGSGPGRTRGRRGRRQDTRRCENWGPRPDWGKRGCSPGRAGVGDRRWRTSQDYTCQCSWRSDHARRQRAG